MANFLILYSTSDGHTLKICKRLQQLLQQHAHQVKLTPVTAYPDLDLELFDKIIIGASIRYGKHRPLVYEFIKRNKAVLESKPNAFFSVNIVARKPEKNRPETNPYMKKFLKKSVWQPKELAVFAGKLDYPLYGFLDRNMIRLIMWLTKGPTEPNTVVEFTNWSEVEAFGQRISAM